MCIEQACVAVNQRIGCCICRKYRDEKQQQDFLCMNDETRLPASLFPVSRNFCRPYGCQNSKSWSFQFKTRSTAFPNVFVLGGPKMVAVRHKQSKTIVFTTETQSKWVLCSAPFPPFIVSRMSFFSGRSLVCPDGTRCFVLLIHLNITCSSFQSVLMKVFLSFFLEKKNGDKLKEALDDRNQGKKHDKCRRFHLFDGY